MFTDLVKIDLANLDNDSANYYLQCKMLVEEQKAKVRREAQRDDSSCPKIYL